MRGGEGGSGRGEGRREWRLGSYVTVVSGRHNRPGGLEARKLGGRGHGGVQALGRGLEAWRLDGGLLSNPSLLQCLLPIEHLELGGPETGHLHPANGRVWRSGGLGEFAPVPLNPLTSGIASEGLGRA